MTQPCNTVEEMLIGMRRDFHNPSAHPTHASRLGSAVYTHYECVDCYQVAIHRSGDDPIKYQTATREACPIGLARAAKLAIGRSDLVEAQAFLDRLIAIRLQEFHHI
jgi:hypothetical protein